MDIQWLVERTLRFLVTSAENLALQEVQRTYAMFTRSDQTQEQQTEQ